MNAFRIAFEDADCFTRSFFVSTAGNVSSNSRTENPLRSSDSSHDRSDVDVGHHGKEFSGFKRQGRAVEILVYVGSDINQNPYRCPYRLGRKTPHTSKRPWKFAEIIYLELLSAPQAQTGSQKSELPGSVHSTIRVVVKRPLCRTFELRYVKGYYSTLL
jgi:hypothetical protein